MSDVRKDFVSAPEQESPVNKESQWGSHQPLLGGASGCAEAVPAGVVGGLQVLGRDNI